MRYLVFLILLGSCSTPQHHIEFEKFDLLPDPVPGIVILPPKEQVIYTKTSVKIESCHATYHDTESEIKAKLHCLKTLR